MSRVGERVRRALGRTRTGTRVRGRGEFPVDVVREQLLAHRRTVERAALEFTDVDARLELARLFGAAEVLSHAVDSIDISPAKPRRLLVAGLVGGFGDNVRLRLAALRKRERT